MTKITNTARGERFRLRGHKIEVFGRSIGLPASRIGRIALGIALLIGGLFSFLPVLGIWMIPVGLLVLSVDLALVRRWRRRAVVRWYGREKTDEVRENEPQ